MYLEKIQIVQIIRYLRKIEISNTLDYLDFSIFLKCLIIQTTWIFSKYKYQKILLDKILESSTKYLGSFDPKKSSLFFTLFIIKDITQQNSTKYFGSFNQTKKSYLFFTLPLKVIFLETMSHLSKKNSNETLTHTLVKIPSVSSQFLVEF